MIVFTWVSKNNYASSHAFASVGDALCAILNAKITDLPSSVWVEEKRDNETVMVQWDTLDWYRNQKGK